MALTGEEGSGRGVVSPSAGCSCAACDYRSLYEGTVSSLSEMASNQRASVSRLGALRSALAGVLEQHFPRQVRAVESRSGRRVGDLSDTEVVALLSGFLGDRTGVLRREVLGQVAEELSSRGVTVSPDDPSSWFDEFSAAASKKPGSEAAAQPSAPDPEPSRAPSEQAPAAVPAPAPAEPEDSSAPSPAAAPFATRPLFGPRAAAAAPPAADPEPQQAEDSAPEVLAVPETGVPDEPAVEAPRRAPVELFQPPLRPGVPEAPRTAPRSRRTRRMDAVADLPGYEPEDAAPASALLNHEIRTSLMAAALLPRPVFTSDLVGVVGTADAVEAWEAECRSEPDASPVRFIAPKSRHRHRGRLVVPASPSASPSDWWARCVDRYRAGRLYELAVVLRSVSDTVTSVTLRDDSAVIRTSSPTGVGALVVLLAPEANDSYAEGLAEVLEPLMSERLSLIAILTASAERGSRDALASAARRVFADRGWKPESPVVAATSWEYADDPRSAAVFVGEAA